MNITFLVGNGFDIGIGLHTRYPEFYEVYCKENKKDNDNIKSFKSVLKTWTESTDEEKKVTDWSDFEKTFGTHSSCFKKEEKSLYLERYEDFVSNFNKYIENEEKRALLVNSSLIAKTMQEALKNYYLNLNPGDLDVISLTYKKFSNKYTYNFITFNYTRTLDHCVEILKHSLKDDTQNQFSDVVHIHGYIDENMIMGVDNSLQITNVDFANDFLVQHELVKQHQNSDLKTNYDKKMIYTIDNSDIVCIYGMSIGATDRKWWNYIAQWLHNNSSRYLIILSHEKDYNSRLPFTQQTLMFKIKNKFLDLSGVDSSTRSNVYSRIIVGINNDVFEMDLTKRDDLKNLKRETDDFIEYKISEDSSNTKSEDKELATV